MRTIIGFCGPIGCGKSTAAQTLVQDLGFYRLRFADPLKQMLMTIGCGYEEVDGFLKETTSRTLMYKTPRYAMQTLGTEWGRNCMGEDFWVYLWKHKAMDYGTANIVVDDVRFSNEVDAIHTLGGRVIKIEREMARPAIDHTSETQRLIHDSVLWNNLSKEEFINAVRAYARAIQ